MAHQFAFSPFILDKLPIPQSGFDVVQDLIEPRLRLYITSHGVKSFFVRKRIHGKDKRIIIGKYPETDIDQAREKVPVVLESATAPIKISRKKIAFKKAVDLYLDKKIRRTEDSRDKLVRSIHRHLCDLFDINIQDMTSTDIELTLNKIEGLAVRNRMHELLHAVFNYSIENGWTLENPADMVVKIPEHRRVRPLNKSGLQRLIGVIKQEKDANLRSAFLMLIYGFAPKSKIFSMKWRDLDFNHYTWCDRPLSDAAVVLLECLPQNGKWVFPGRGGRPLTDPRMTWKRIARDAKIENLTMDDVYKFLSRQLNWASDREDFRFNMNALIDTIME